MLCPKNHNQNNRRQAVIAHELAHVCCDHGVWLTLAHALASGTAQLLPLVSDGVSDALLRWRRAVELTCDRAALLVVQDCGVVVGALMKLAGGCPSLAHELSVEAFLEQVRGGGGWRGREGLRSLNAQN